MKLGEFIRKYRENLRLSVRELGRMAEVSGPYISMIETNKIDTPPSKELIKKISVILKLSEELEFFYKLYEESVQERINKKISSLKHNISNVRENTNYGVIVGNNEWGINYHKNIENNNEIISLEGLSEEDKKAAREFIEYLKSKNK